MIIRRIEVQNFRKLSQRLVIDSLSSGLSIIAGDNEEGKSTLLQCIRIAFFEKHIVGGDRANSFQPYDSKVRPEIRVDFELAGKPYKLFKAFCQRPEAELVTPTGRFSGAAAEDELAKLLRFTPKRGRRNDGDHDHEGIFGMFWVEQGRSFAPLEPNDDGRSAIVQALQREVGDVLGGKRGQRIRAEVVRLRAEMLTSTGKPRGKYADALDMLERLEQEVLKLDSILKLHEDNTEQLQRCRNHLQSYRKDATLERAQSRLHAAHDNEHKIALLLRSLEDAENALATSQIKKQLASDRVEQRMSVVESVVEAQRRLDQLFLEWQNKETATADIRVSLEADEKAAVQARSELEIAQRDFLLAELTSQLGQIETEIVRLEQSRNAASQAKSARDEAISRAATITINKKDLATLRGFEDAVTRARARAEAAATRICLKLAPGLKAKLNDVVVTGQEKFKLTRPVILKVPDCLELAITPSTSAGDPELELENELARFRQELTKFHVENVTQAEAQLDGKSDAQKEAQRNADLLHAHAPEGIEYLEQKILSATTERQRLLQLKQKYVQLEQCAIPDLSVARATRDEAHQRANLINNKVEEGRRQLAALCIETAACQARHESQGAHLSETKKRLDAARDEVPDSELNESLLFSSTEAKNATATVEAARQTLNASNPEVVAREARTAEAALNQIQNDIQTLEQKALRLEAELRANGALGLEERREELSSELTGARTEAARLRSQAKSLELLNQVLAEAEQAARECFLRPVSERVKPYLELLLPNCDLALNENLHILGLRRKGIEEKFESLSLGTREQLAVLTRLAFADLLREQGHPATVLLDDAVVYADDLRFDRMLHILQKAAEHLQIVIFTCRERDYRSAGARLIRLSNCISTEPFLQTLKAPGILRTPQLREPAGVQHE